MQDDLCPLLLFLSLQLLRLHGLVFCILGMRFSVVVCLLQTSISGYVFGVRLSWLVLFRTE